MTKKLLSEKLMTIKDIAKIAKVSPTTVSLVINNQPGVSADTRERLSIIIRALKYQPNLIARSLVKRHSYAIAMLITNTRNPIFPEIAAGVDDVLNEFGYSLSIISTYDQEKIQAEKIDKIRARGVDGIIASSVLKEDESIRNLVQSGYPVISVLRRAYNCPELDYINVDNIKGGYLAAEHLIRLGHKRIGIIKGPQNTSTGEERFKGVLQAFKEYGLTFYDELVAQGDYFRQSGYQATKKLLGVGKKGRPTALFACNDDMALGAFEAVLDENLRIPDDIALVGFNNMEITALRSIEITTISQRKYEMGQLAAKRLIDKIEKKGGYRKPYQVVLEPELKIRRSCGYGLSSKYLLKKKVIRHS